MHPARDKRVFDKEALSLVGSGYDVVHLCPGSLAEAGIDQGVNVVTYEKPAGIKGRLKQLFKLYALAKAEDADCYHCNEVDSWVIGVLLKIFQKKKCIFDVHEHYPSTFAESRFPNWLQPVVAEFIRLVFLVLTPFTDRIVLAKQTVSSDFHCPDRKKVLVRNFTPLAGLNFAGSRSPLNAGEMVTLTHLGLFNKNRGWPQVLQAIDKMRNKNVRLEVIGEFNDGTRDEFDATVKRYNLENRVNVYNWMPFEQAFQYLTKSQIGLVVFQPGTLNHVYAMPHKMFDYMAAGMAVICPDFAVEVAPFVEKSRCGLLVDPSNPDKLARALDRLVEDPELIKTMGANGQKAVLEQFNWEAEVAQLVKMYKELGSV
jgi:glycosyltransferase involved in cell wall biosynthesis